ncbi:GNAT family N-acetyltransferase [Asanoa sp. NPDC050611]|uniref:GNAT family N-acetyltransferase n=1 Tax=Asanoa sp. NPDC050611 TaxID=3157098 RepID=UPI00340073BD
MPAVQLTPLDDDLTERLLAVAVADADPTEVIPPVEGPPGWTAGRAEFFRAFHHERQAGLAGPLRTVMYAITADYRIVGMIRLTLDESGREAETGMWLARTARGQGLGGAAFERLLDEAHRAGARTVKADTTPGNHAALAVLRRAGAQLRAENDKVYARLELDT